MSLLNSQYDIIENKIECQIGAIVIVKDRLSQKPFYARFIENSSGYQTIDLDRIFRREIELIASCVHPNIANVKETYIGPPHWAIIYECSPTQTLWNYLSERKTLSVSEALIITRDLLDAIDYLHCNNIVFCGIDPRRIIISKERTPVLIDFTYAFGKMSHRGCNDSKFYGFLPFLSPEQTGFTGFGPDSRSDTYCIGILLYTMLTGQTPFQMQNGDLQILLDEMLKRPFKAVENIPAFINSILMKALRPSPEERYQTAEGMRGDVEVALLHVDNPYSISINAGQQDAICSIMQMRWFVGREKELEQLSKQLEKMRSGQPSSLLIRGPAGIGKSELVCEMHNFFDSLWYSFVSVRCDYHNYAHPYSTIRQLISTLASQVMKYANQEYLSYLKNKINHVLEKDVDSLIGLIPEIIQLFGSTNCRTTIKKGKEGNQIIQALSILIKILCEEKVFVIFIDDLHWIDQASLHVLRRILEIKIPCFIISAIRPDTQNTNNFHLYEIPMDDLGIEIIIDLKPFIYSEINNYVKHCFQSNTHFEKLTKTIFERTDRSPLMVKEIISHFLKMKIVTPILSGWEIKYQLMSQLCLRFDYKSIIVERKNRLDFSTQQFLETVVLIGTSLGHEIINRIFGQNKEAIDQCCRKLVEHGFFNRRAESKFTIVNEKTAETILDGISLSRLMEMQKQIAAELENLSKNNPDYLAYTADFYAKSGMYEKAYLFSVAAAEFANENKVLDMAEQYYNKAILISNSLSNSLINLSPSILLKKYAEVLLLKGDNDKALPIFQSLLSDKNIASEVNIEILYSIGTIYHNIGNFDQCIDYFTLVLKKLGVHLTTNRSRCSYSIGWELIVYLSNRFGFKFHIKAVNDNQNQMVLNILNKLTYLFYLKDSRLSVLVHLKALNRTARLSDSYGSYLIHADHIIINHQLGLRQRAYKYLTFIQKIVESAQDETIAHIQTIAGIINYYDANWCEATTYLNRAIDKCRSIGDMWGQLTPLKHLGFIAFYQGDLSKAIESFTLEWKLSEKCGDLRGSIRALVHLKFLKGIDTEDDWNALYKRQLEFNDPLMQTMTYSTIAFMLLIKNNILEAYETIIKALNLIRNEKLNQEYVAFAFPICCSVLVKERLLRLEGNRTIQKSDTEIVFFHNYCLKKAESAGKKFPAHKGVALRCKAWVYALEGHKKKARKLFLESCDYHHRLGMRYEEAKSTQEFGLFLERFGNVIESKGAHLHANELFNECGAIREVRVLTDNAQSLLIADSAQLNEKSSIHLRIDVLHQLTASINKIDDIDLLLKHIVKVLLKITGAQEGIAYLESKEGALQPAVAMNFEEVVLKSFNKPCPENLYLASRNDACVVICRNQLWCENNDNSSSLQNSLMVVPLHGRNKFIGCVCLSNQIVGGLYSHESKKIAEIVASHAAILIENAELLQQYKILNDNLKQQVRNQTLDIRNKNELLEEYYLKVIDSQRIKDLLTGAIVHDIKNAIFSIAADARNLIKYSAENIIIIHKLNNIRQNCTSIFEMAVNMLDITRMEEGKLVVNKQLMSILEIRNIFNKYAHTSIFEEKNIQIRFVEIDEVSLLINADSYLLERVFQNLLNNAAKYTPVNGTTKVSITKVETEIIVSFFSSGTPIPEHFRDVIFEKYAVTGEIRSIYSKGLGLFYCKLVMQAHGGRIWVECSEKGNCFKLAFIDKTLKEFE